MNHSENNSNSTWMIVILIVALVLGYWLYSTHTNLPDLGTISNKNYTVTTDKQPLNPAQIDNILCTNHSPACNTGSTFYQNAIRTGISATYALAVFKAESSYGTAGVARYTKGIGNIICTPGYDCVQGFRAYPTWEAGEEDWFNLIKNLYINEKKLTTVATIANVYAPPSSNDTNAYVANIESTMTSLSK
jgi:hypothetical protein